MTLPASAGWILDAPIAHRGLHNEQVPENSLEALECAACAGYHAEVDVRSSADGVPVVFHDSNLDRLTPASGPVAGRNWDQLRTLALGSSSTIPSLGQAIEVLRGRCGLLVEIKNPGSPGVLEHAVAELVQKSSANIAVMSFNVATVHWFRKHHPNILRGQLACRFDSDPRPAWKKYLLSRYAFNPLVQPHFVGHRWQDLPARSLLGKPLPLPVLAWTVNSPRAIDQARHHADNIIFENLLP